MRDQTFTAFPGQAADRLFCPLCLETETRLQRLNVMDQEGRINEKGIQNLCVVLGISLYEKLFDVYEDVTALFDNLSELYGAGDASGMYLYFCVMYGEIGEDVPAPLQWLASHKSALMEYFSAYLDLMLEYLTQDDLLTYSEKDEAPPGLPGSEQEAAHET